MRMTPCTALFSALLVLFPIWTCADDNGAALSFSGTLLHAQPTADVVRVRTATGAEQSVRLYGIACPVAGQVNATLAGNRIAGFNQREAVDVEVLTEDSDGLPVAWLRLKDGPSLNEVLVREGFAWWDEPNAPNAKGLSALMVEALQEKRGLWKNAAPLAPWDYRTSHSLATVRYSVIENTSEPNTPTPVPSETPTIAAKGAPKPKPAGLPEIPEDYMGLVVKHQPRIARDDQGNALGLTASDINKIPGAGQLGFQNGDIVQSINGINLTNEAQLFGLVSQLQGAKELNIKVNRGGKPVVLKIPL